MLVHGGRDHLAHPFEEGVGFFWFLWLAALCGVLLSSRRWKWAVAALMTPLLFPAGAFASGAVRYWNGTGRLEGFGFPGIESDNLDPESRAPWAGGGCEPWGNEQLTLEMNNRAIRLMGLFFGPMPGAYRGPYPAREEAFRIVQKNGKRIFPESRGRYRLPDMEFPVSPGLIEELQVHIDDDSAVYVAQDGPQLLLVRGRAYGSEVVYLIDAVGARHVAVYRDR